MKPLPTLSGMPSEPHQLSMPLDAPKLRGLNRAERDTAVGALAALLLEAEGAPVEENEDSYV